MQIDRIKISQEINFMGMPTWIGLEGTLLPGEDEKQGLRSLQKSITEYLQEEESRMPKKKWGNKPDTSEAISGILESIEKCTTPEELKSYWIISKGNLVLSEAYKAKEKQLTDAK